MMTHAWRPLRLGAVLALVLLMAPIASAVATDESVSIGDKLSPKNLTVAPGTNVTWVNDDDERHRMRSESGPEEFDSGNLEAGETFTFNFAIEGSYSYIDDRNDEDTAYHGTITVTAEAPPPDPGEPPPPPPAAGDVTIVDRSFQPASLTISPGGTVTWANNDDDEHTVTANDGSWDSGIFGGGATFDRTFADPGTYAYFCIIHPDMTGTITVVGEEGEPPPPAPPPPDPEPAPQPPAPPPVAGDVNIFDFGFTPGNLTVGVGSSVTWTNTGAAPHTVTDDAGRFDSGFLFAGDTYTRTFDAVGTYDYICTLHPEMTATVVVDGGGTSPPAPGDPEPAPNDPIPPPPAQPASGDITIVDNAFSPGTKNVTTGTTVVWANAGAVPHTVTSSSGAFDSGFLFAGDTYSRTFSSPGTYDYLCTIHPGMAGSIVVTGAPTGDPPGDEAATPTDPSASDTGGGEAAGAASVSIVDNAFAPQSVTVAAGSSVSWVNSGALPHTVTSQAGGFDSGILLPAAGFSVRLTTPGVYDYVCTLHPEMAGTIVVTEASGPVDEGDALIESAAAEDGEATGRRGEATGDAGADTEPLISRTVQMIDNAFQPRAVTVESGEAVRWRNEGVVPHTATLDGVFDSGFVESGNDFVQVFDELGTYEYVCTIHPEMTGTIEVIAPVTEGAAGGGSAGTPAAPLDPAVAFVMAGGIVVAVGLMAFGMARFAAAAGEMR